MDHQAGTIPSGTTVARTDALHPDGQYTAVAKAFHWITVVLMAVALTIGFLIKFMKDDSKMVFYAIHESAGLTILFVSIARLVWRRLSPPPALPDHVPANMRFAAAAVHHGLYALLILQPIMGFLMTNAFGFPMQGATAYLGFIDIPAVIGEMPRLAAVLGWVHTIFGYAIVVLLAAHIGGAVFHHAIRRDGTLLRML